MGPLRIVIAIGLLCATPRLPDIPSPDLSDGRDPAAAQRCLIDLTLARARHATLPNRELGEGCTQWNAVSLGDFPGEDRTIEPSGLGPVACPTARAFYGWARYAAAPAAEAAFGSTLARIETYGSYACRNVAGTARRSGHASARAIDVAGFVLADGRRISVEADWDGPDPAKRAFLRNAHRAACGRFDSVLGPDYNAAHRDHFHFETGGWSACR